jgi:hypothetical protein
MQKETELLHFLQMNGILDQVILQRHFSWKRINRSSRTDDFTSQPSGDAGARATVQQSLNNGLWAANECQID